MSASFNMERHYAQQQIIHAYQGNHRCGTAHDGISETPEAESR
jgi:hypothetical protein